MDKNSFTEVKSCRACGSSILKNILDLGDQPLANSFIPEKTNEQYFPLSLNLCESCYHLQLSVAVNPSKMFENYLYVSGTSNTLQKYFDWFADFVLNDLNKISKIDNPSVLDIACNDGSQLDHFLSRGCETFGIDPAANITPLALKKGHKVLTRYWNNETAAILDKKFEIIIAQNVFAHVNDVVDFLENCKSVLKDHGTIYIQTSQANMVLNNEFDTIYHEHLSFFNIKSMKEAANRAGLTLYDVHKTPIHGISYVFVLRNLSEDISQPASSKMLVEENSGLYNIATYQQYVLNVKQIRDSFVSICNQLRKDGLKIIGYGAAAKGNTFLNFAKFKLDYIVDDNCMKHNLLSPGLNIPVLSPDQLIKEDPDSICVVPLAWNFFDEIKEKVNVRLGCNPKYYLKYFPEPKLEH